MDTVKSIMGYGKVDETQDIAFKRKTRKQRFSVAIAAVVLVAIVIGAVIAGLAQSRKNESSRPSSNEGLTPAASIKSVCSATHYPDSCISSISKFPSSNTTDPEIIFKLSLQAVAEELASITDLPGKLAEKTEAELLKSALSVCGNLFDLAMDRINETISEMKGDGGGDNVLNSKKINSLQTLLTAALTFHYTCLDALDEAALIDTDYSSYLIKKNLTSAMVNSTEYTSNSLAIVAKVLSALSDIGIPIHRRLLSSNSFPDWISPRARRLLQAKKLKPDVTVAADGSGDVKTVNEAVARVPVKGETMFLIYVKAGTYVENVVLDKHKWNVMLYGAGKDKTTISGSKNNHQNISTAATATLVVQGKGFIMKNMRIINTAGPEKHQAVAFRSESDRSAIYQCSFDAYQDTLYPHGHHQFFRDCDITGTVDFIFGNAAVVLQNCNIRPRQPLPNQYNTITFQGRVDHNMNSGISIQRCKIFANGVVTVPTYLGRPWKERSTTVIMETEIGPLVIGPGWIAWNSTFDPPQSTIYYGEYKNTGPGAGLSKRVKWTGYKPVLSDAEARFFTAASFLEGADWLPATGFPCQLT